MLVEMTREGRRKTPHADARELDGDLEHREQVLSARRREVLGKALLAEIAEHLRARITRSGRRSARATRPCGAARPAPGGRSASPGTPTRTPARRRRARAARGPLGRALLDAAQRDALFAFLEPRIADARAGAADAGAADRDRRPPRGALDYRRWWSFTLICTSPTGPGRS